MPQPSVPFLHLWPYRPVPASVASSIISLAPLPAPRLPQCRRSSNSSVLGACSLSPPTPHCALRALSPELQTNITSASSWAPCPGPIPTHRNASPLSCLAHLCSKVPSSHRHPSLKPLPDRPTLLAANATCSLCPSHTSFPTDPQACQVPSWHIAFACAPPSAWSAPMSPPSCLIISH